MNEEGKELTVEFLMQHLEVEDCNAHHKSLSQLDSTTSVNFAAYDHRQNKGKNYHKIGHFHKVCQTKKRAKQRANLVQTTPPPNDDDTHIDRNGVRQPNPPRVNMFKLVNHIEANRGRMEGKHLKFPTASHLKGPTNTI